MNIKNLIREEVLNQKAYSAPEISCPIKLDANESPYDLSPFLKSKIIEAIKKVSLNRYPEPGSPELRAGFSKLYGVTSDMLLIGNGSDELIQILLIAVKRQASSIIVPTPTFVMYKISALNNGHEVIEVPLDKQFDLDVDYMFEIMEVKSPDLIFLSYPNNPTGNCFDSRKIEAILKETDGIVVVDEAYFNFSGKTFLSYLDKHENLVILRTLSKVGLAAMRIGILIGSPPLIHELNKVRLPYNLNTLSQITARLYIENEAAFQKEANKIVSRRDELFTELKKIDGIHLYPSDANFILFSCSFDTDSVYHSLIKKGILIKKFETLGILENCMRVTTGTREENGEFLKAMKTIIFGEELKAK